MHHYQIYGIPVQSQLKLPFLHNGSGDSLKKCITIELGPIPKHLSFHPSLSNEFTAIAPEEMQFEIPHLGRFYVTHGEHILIDTAHPDDPEIAAYTCTVALNVVLAQRNIVTYHASGVFLNPEEVVLFAAPSKTGKSTTMTTLQALGYAPFTDDTCTLYTEGTATYAMASIPLVKLWKESVDANAYYADQPKTKIIHKENKYGFTFHEQFQAGAFKVRAMVFLNKAEEDLTFRSLSPIKAFQWLMQNIYGYKWYVGQKQMKILFQEVSSLANALPCYEATRPVKGDSRKALAELIIHHLK